MSKQAMIAINALVFGLVNNDTREDAENHTTICHILLPHRQGILALVAGLASCLLSLSVQKRMLALCPFLHARSYSRLAKG